MPASPTVRIEHSGFPDGLVINASAFDEATMTRWEDHQAAVATAAAAADAQAKAAAAAEAAKAQKPAK